MTFDEKSEAHVPKIRNYKSHVAHSSSIKKKKLSKKALGRGEAVCARCTKNIIIRRNNFW